MRINGPASPAEYIGQKLGQWIVSKVIKMSQSDSSRQQKIANTVISYARSKASTENVSVDKKTVASGNKTSKSL